MCVDLCQPAFYSRKPNWEDLAEFVYSVLAEGGTSSPQQVRAAVVDIQLHPVKKLLFLKFTDQVIRDEVATRLQSGLTWPAFATTVTGWGMDKPVERIRVLGASPETDERGVRSILGAYGEVLEARKGFISKKLPGCTNGIWNVKLILEENKLLPPFLIMKEEGEVWQLATGEVSVCWKCGKSGHIGDKCHQDVSVSAASLASPAVSLQPSWAHVVSGARTGPQCPRPPPLPPCPIRAGVLCEPVSREALARVQPNLRSYPVLPLARDDNGQVIKFGKVLASQGDTVVGVEKAVASVEAETIEKMVIEVAESFADEAEAVLDKNVEMLETVLPPPAAVVVLDVEVERVVGVAVESVLEVTVDRFVMENVEMFVDNFLDRLDKNIDEAVDRVLDETVDRSVLEAVYNAIDQATNRDIVDEVVNEAPGLPPGAAVGDEAASPGSAKLLKAGSGSTVAGSDISSVSPPRARKVAVSNPEHSSEKIESGGRIIKYKNFTIEFPEGTEYEGGRILFCYDKSCRHEAKNICENIEDYFVKLDDKCILDHTCLGRAKSVTKDKYKHVMQPTANVSQKQLVIFWQQLGMVVFWHLATQKLIWISCQAISEELNNYVLMH